MRKNHLILFSLGFFVSVCASVFSMEPRTLDLLLARTEMLRAIAADDITSFEAIWSESEIDPLQPLASYEFIDGNRQIEIVNAPLIFAAAATGSIGIIKHLLQRKDFQKRFGKGGLGLLYIRTINNKNCMIHTAIESGQAAFVKFLLKQDLNLVAVENPLGHTPVHYASNMGHADILAIVFDELEKRFGKKDEYFSVLHKACNRGWRAMHYAASRGAIASAKFLLERHPELLHVVTTKSPEKHHSIHLAARSNQVEFAKFLLEKDPDVLQIKSNFGRQASHFAAAHDAVEFLDFLLEQDQDCLHELDNYGSHPVHVTEETSNKNSLRFFINLDPNLLNLPEEGNGWCLIHFAVGRRNIVFLKFLLLFLKTNVAATTANDSSVFALITYYSQQLQEDGTEETKTKRAQYQEMTQLLEEELAERRSTNVRLAEQRERIRHDFLDAYHTRKLVDIEIVTKPSEE